MINPYFDDPKEFFSYDADDIVKEVKIVPFKAIFGPYVWAAEENFGINRIELKNFRYSVYSKFRVLKKAYRNLNDLETKNEVKTEIDDMLSDEFLFAGMNRFL